MKNNNHQVIYFEIDDPRNPQNLKSLIQQIIKEYSIEKFDFQLPDEYRLDEQLNQICQQLIIPSEAFDTEHFYTTRTELAEFFLL